MNSKLGSGFGLVFWLFLFLYLLVFLHSNCIIGTITHSVEINGAKYDVTKDPQPDGTGMAVVVLSKYGKL